MMRIVSPNEQSSEKVSVSKSHTELKKTTKEVATGRNTGLRLKFENVPTTGKKLAKRGSQRMSNREVPKRHPESARKRSNEDLQQILHSEATDGILK